MRLKFIICYDGNFLNGWFGSSGFFVKNFLEEALEKITSEKTIFFCSGRTDSGVSAINQVCHCDLSDENFHGEKIKPGMNFLLPNFIKIISCEKVSEDFHARFSAKKRKYMYLFYQNDFEIPLLKNRAFLVKKFNKEEVKKCLNYLIGCHDFSTFCPKKYSGKKIRTMEECFLEESTDIFGYKIYKFFFIAKSFAHHQIRNIMGGIFEVCKENWSYENFVERMNKKQRIFGGNTMPSFALYFVESIY
jgi:tRNA pseudouridine38-40 synthase